MENYSYKMTVGAKDEKEAVQKMEALKTLASKLSAKELTKMADVVANDPIKTKLAKTYLGLN